MNGLGKKTSDGGETGGIKESEPEEGMEGGRERERQR